MEIGETVKIRRVLLAVKPKLTVMITKSLIARTISYVFLCSCLSGVNFNFEVFSNSLTNIIDAFDCQVKE